jgi:hypothetical protein
MLTAILTPRYLACLVEGSVKCDSGSTVARATLDGGVRFPGEFFIIAGAFAPGQVLNFGSLAYIINCYGELSFICSTGLH